MSEMLRQVIMMMGKVTSSGITFINSTVSSTDSLSKPAGTVAGDLIVIVGSNGSAGLWTQPSGFTLLTASSTYGNMCYKFAGGSEPSSYNFYSTGGGGLNGTVCLVFRGATTVDVVGSGAGVTGTSVAAPSVTTTVANTMLIAAFTANAASTIGTASGMTKVANAGGAPATCQYQALTSAGATGTRTASSSVSAELTAGMFAVR